MILDIGRDCGLFETTVSDLSVSVRLVSLSVVSSPS
jgi:hypothetical protein